MFRDDGTLSGTTGCNQFTTSFTTDGDALVLEPAAVTLMACLDEVADQEAAFLALLGDSPTYQLADDDEVLLLESASGATMTAQR